jgi:hypothetical protein
MEAHDHQQKDVIRLTKLPQPQVSKFLGGQRRRLTPAVRALCQYAGFDLEPASASPALPLALSQPARQVLEDNPRAAAMAARVIEALMPVLERLANTPLAPEEAP